MGVLGTIVTRDWRFRFNINDYVKKLYNGIRTEIKYNSH